MENYYPPVNLPGTFIRLGDLRFRLFIPQATIQERVTQLAQQIKREYAGKDLVMICVLKGAALFAADLMQAAEIPGELDFVRLSSYDGTTSTEHVEELMSSTSRISGRHVLIVEDIVDTGGTLDYYIKKLKQQDPASIELAALLLKPEALKFPIDVKYLGFKIPNLFVVGYGLDYNEAGREFRDIYQLDLPNLGLH